MLATGGRGSLGGFQQMMRRDENGVSEFLIHAPGAAVVELTIDFTNGFVRTLAMKRFPDGTWRVRIHGVTAGFRYRFRIDGRTCSEPDSGTRDSAGWTRITRAA
ncbi:MAG: hypothetical protein CMO40_09465 [Verrucomicrobiaceae bacterium]|nr:hypothetical protein [Verrucomicrobiaceae bacterium]